MIPIGDYAGARQRFPIINIALIVANVLAFVYSFSQPVAVLTTFFYQWGVVPHEIVTGIDAPPTITLPIYVTLLTSIFLHGSWAHLFGNMLFLWVFGDNVENAFGPVKYLLFYLACALGAAAAQIAINPGATTPMVGASGAIAGVMGAYLVLFPGATVRTIVLFFVIQLPAILVIGGWFLLQLFYGLTSLGVATQAESGVAFFAHIGGLIVGALLALLLRRPTDRYASPSTFGGYGRW